MAGCGPPEFGVGPRSSFCSDFPRCRCQRADSPTSKRAINSNTGRGGDASPSVRETKTIPVHRMRQASMRDMDLSTTRPANFHRHGGSLPQRDDGMRDAKQNTKPAPLRGRCVEACPVSAWAVARLAGLGQAQRTKPGVPKRFPRISSGSRDAMEQPREETETLSPPPRRQTFFSYRATVISRRFPASRGRSASPDPVKLLLMRHDGTGG